MLTTLGALTLGRIMQHWEIITQGRGRAARPLGGAFADIGEFGEHVVALASWIAEEAGYNVNLPVATPAPAAPGPHAELQRRLRATMERSSAANAAAAPAPSHALVPVRADAHLAHLTADGRGEIARPGTAVPAEAKVAFVHAAVRAAATARYLARDMAYLMRRGVLYPHGQGEAGGWALHDGLLEILGSATLRLPTGANRVPDFEPHEIRQAVEQLPPDRVLPGGMAGRALRAPGMMVQQQAGLRRPLGALPPNRPRGPGR